MEPRLSINNNTQLPVDGNRFNVEPSMNLYTLNGKSIVVLVFSWQGQYHFENNSECQDFASIYPQPNNNEINQLTLVVADGVGTRTRSRQGAKFACDAIGSTLNGMIGDEKPLEERFKAAQAKFNELCRNHSRNIDYQGETSSTLCTDSGVIEYATTALTLCLNPSGFWAASVGDGAIYRISEGGKSAQQLTIIHRQGFINEVIAFTSEQWQDSFSQSDKDFTAYNDTEGFCLMTDGLSDNIGDANIFFNAVWPKLQQTLNDPTAMREYAQAFCRYWEDHNFSSDDKTLIAVFLET